MDAHFHPKVAALEVLLGLRLAEFGRPLANALWGGAMRGQSFGQPPLAAIVNERYPMLTCPVFSNRAAVISFGCSGRFSTEPTIRQIFGYFSTDYPDRAISKVPQP